MPRIVAFLTHSAHSDAELAAAIRTAIHRDFSGAVDVFVSSDPDSLPAGIHWMDELTAKLRQCRIQILLLSAESLQRPWIHFEAGAGWARGDVTQVPLCHSGLAPSDLKPPLALLQAGRLEDPQYLRSMYLRIAAEASQNVPEVDFGGLSQELRQAAPGPAQMPALPQPVDTLVERAAQRVQLADTQRTAIRNTRDAVAQAMHHYAIEWQGQARGGTDDGKATALAAAEQARASATEVDDAGIRAAVANWRRQVQSADMSYLKGAEPPGRGDLEATAESLLDELGAFLRS